MPPEHRSLMAKETRSLLVRPGTHAGASPPRPVTRDREKVLAQQETQVCRLLMKMKTRYSMTVHALRVNSFLGSFSLSKSKDLRNPKHLPWRKTTVVLKRPP